MQQGLVNVLLISSSGAFLVQARPGAVIAWDTTMKSTWVFLALLVIAGPPGTLPWEKAW